MPISMNEWNQKTFSTKENADANRTTAGVFPAEQAIFASLPVETLSGRVLELGVGSGRLTAQLLQRAADYVGIDYSESVLQVAQDSFPDVRLEIGDARDLSRFAQDSFDLVIFSYNGLDYVDHQGRHAVLAEVRRVVRKGGAFAFSFHNMDFHNLNVSRNIAFKDWRSNPFGFLLSLRKNSIARKRKSALLGSEVNQPDYMIINDDGMNHNLLTYYTTVDDQAAQLESYGFKAPLAFDLNGQAIEMGQRFTTDYMIHMVVRA